MLNKFLLFIKGILFGASNLIPGASGGTTLVICGIYDETLDSISSITKTFKKSLIFLLFLLVGTAVGVLGGGKLINIGLEHIPFMVYMLFAGVVLGTIPTMAMPIVKEVKPKYILSFLIAMIAVIALVVIRYLVGGSEKCFDSLAFYDYILLFICGFVGIFAMIIPGVSGVLAFVIFGYYNTLMNAISTLTSDFSRFGSIVLFLIPIALGILCGIIPAAKIIKALITKYKMGSSFAILGFVIGSIVCLFISYFNEGYPSLDTLNIWLGIIGIIVGTIASFSLAFYSYKKSKKEVANND